jgi:hypothetical protein
MEPMEFAYWSGRDCDEIIAVIRAIAPQSAEERERIGCWLLDHGFARGCHLSTALR